MAIEFKLTQKSHDILRSYQVDQGIDTLKVLTVLKKEVTEKFTDDIPSIAATILIDSGCDDPFMINFKLIEFKTTIADDDSVTYSFSYKVLEDN